MILTDLEESEFTAFNALAYDLHRVECKQRDSIPPCWLCMSDEAKIECRKKMAVCLTEMMNTIVPFDVKSAEIYIKSRKNQEIEKKVLLWKQAETEFKRLRVEEHNPRAFFAE